MSASFENVAIFVKPTDMKAQDLQALMDLLKAQGKTVWLSEKSARLLDDGVTQGYTRAYLGEHCDLAIVLGGDGSMLGVARDLAGLNCPLIGINVGRLGFLTDMMISNMHEVLPAMLSGHFIEDERNLIEGKVYRDGQCIFEHVAVNDIGFSNGRVGGIINAAISVDGVPMACQLADGIICSSTTGSTAYSLAAGGPLLHPRLKGMCIVPVAPHTLSNRPIVVPGDSQVQIELVECREAVAYFDMQEFCDAKPGDVLCVRQSDKTVKMLHPQGYDYFELLRRKLNWNFMPAQSAQQKNQSTPDSEQED